MDTKYHPREINSRDINGYSPLYYAVQLQRINIVQILLRMGADVN